MDDHDDQEHRGEEVGEVVVVDERGPEDELRNRRHDRGGNRGSPGISRDLRAASAVSMTTAVAIRMPGESQATDQPPITGLLFYREAHTP